MNHQIQMVFLDIDGTLYCEGQLVPSAKAAVAELQQKGIFVALCTGRSVLHTRSIQQELNVSYGVFFNGGLVEHKRDILFATPIPNDSVSNIIDYFNEIQLPIILHTDDEVMSFEQIPDDFMPILTAFEFPPIKIISPDDWAETPQQVYQVNAFMDKSWDYIVQTKFPECLIYRWDKQAVDLQRRQSDKSIGAQALLTRLNISPENAMHIGDGGNDIGMFKTMGYSVAMGNASDEVKRFAQTVTHPVDEDGVYHALKNVGLL